MINAMEEEFELVNLFGKPALYIDDRVNGKTVPEGFYKYETRHSDDCDEYHYSIEKKVKVNNSGTVLTMEELKFPKGQNYLELEDNFDLQGKSMTIDEFCEMLNASSKQAMK